MKAAVSFVYSNTTVLIHSQTEAYMMMMMMMHLYKINAFFNLKSGDLKYSGS